MALFIWNINVPEQQVNKFYFPPASIHDLEKFIPNLKASHFGVLSLHEGSFYLHLMYDFCIYEI